jgi:hypothetical protein
LTIYEKSDLNPLGFRIQDTAAGPGLGKQDTKFKEVFILRSLTTEVWHFPNPKREHLLKFP